MSLAPRSWSEPLRSMLSSQSQTPTFLLFEGADGVGKTTVAKDWAAVHGWTYRHNAHDTSSADLYAKYEAQSGTCQQTCVDRTFVSEQVYGTVLRGRSRLSTQQCRNLATLMSQRGGVFVHVTASPTTIVERLMRRDGKSPNASQITALLQTYEQVFEQLDTATVVRLTTDH